MTIEHDNNNQSVALNRAAAEKAAFEAGGSRLVAGVKYIADNGYCFPVSEDIACRVRGVGKFTIEKLRQIGLVVGPTHRIGEISGLSTKAATRLINFGILTREAARMAILEGTLKPNRSGYGPYLRDGTAYRLRGYGFVLHKEVCKWAGLPEPERPAMQYLCPHCGKNVYSRNGSQDQPKAS